MPSEEAQMKASSLIRSDRWRGESSADSACLRMVGIATMGFEVKPSLRQERETLSPEVSGDTVERAEGCCSDQG